MRTAALMLALLAGGDMGFPRARLQTTKDAINRRLLTAGQEGRYAPEAWVRPSTMDAAAATGTLSVAAGSESAWVATRLKGVVREETFNAVQLVVDYTTAASITANIVVAFCKYSDENPESLIIREVTRGRLVQTVAAPGSGGVREVVSLTDPVTLTPGEKYALAVKFSASGAGSVALSCAAGRAEAFTTEALGMDSAFVVDFNGLDRTGPVVQVGGNPVLMTMVADRDTSAARNIKNWY